MGITKIMNVLIVFLLVALYGHIPVCRGEPLLQIVAPERQSSRKDLSIAMRKSFEYRVSTRMSYISNQHPNPEEVVNFFCDEVFPNNASAILSLNYGLETSMASDYISQAASALGYPVISWDLVYSGSLSVS